MNGAILRAIAGGLLNVVVILLLAPLCQGVLRKITARIQSRQGPPLLQPYFDLLKLLGKEDIESGEIPAMQRFVAYFSLATVLDHRVLRSHGFSGSDERRRGRHSAGLSADALGNLHAVGWPGVRIDLLAAGHQPRDDGHDFAGAVIRNRHRGWGGSRALSSLECGTQRLDLW